MQTVIETESYLRDVKAVGLTEEERTEIVDFVALNPDAGNEIKGTGEHAKYVLLGRGKVKVEAIGLLLFIAETTSLYFY